MDLVLSPYDISAQSIAAMAAPLLAWPSGSVLTLRPEPLEGPDSGALTRAAAGVAGMARFIESWRWTGRLWREGVFRARTERAEPIEAVRALCARIATEPALAMLRPVVSPALFEESETYLNALLRDLERGGGDPKVTLPVQSGLEALAAGLGVPIVRAHRPPARPLAGPTPLFSFSLPLLAEADGDSIVELLHSLEPELAALNDVLKPIVDEAIECGRPSDSESVRALELACGAYAAAFTRASPALGASADAAGDPFRPCEALITAEIAEPGGSLTAAARGFGRLAGSAPRTMGSAPTPGLVRAGSGPLLVLSVRRLPFEPASA